MVFILFRYTRAVVLEFNVYNPNVNLFSLVTILFEYPCFGGAIITGTVKSVKMYRYFGPYGPFALGSEIIVILFTIFLTIKLIISIVKQKRQFFHSFWNLMELAKLICAVAAIMMYVQRVLLVQSTVEEMMNNKGINQLHGYL